VAHIAVADTFSGRDLAGRDGGSRRQFTEPLAAAGQGSKQGGICAGSLHLAWEDQAGFDATTPHLERYKTGQSQVGSAAGEPIGWKKRAQIECYLHAFPLQLDSLYERARIRCRLKLLIGFDLGIDTCLSSAAAKPQALRVEASPARSERIRRMPTITACSVRSAGKRQPPSSGFAVPLTSLFQTK
jgi:hypothetical protein